MSDIQKQDRISDDNRFVGKRVLVTGTAQGIGQRIAQRFVQAGAEVIGLDRQPRRPRATAQAMRPPSSRSSWT